MSETGTRGRRAVSRRGMTLLETLMAAALSSIIIAAAAALLVASGRMVHNTEHVADSHDHARLAGDAVLTAVRQAGAGAGQGVWVVSSGVPTRTNAIFGQDGGPNAPDDLWLVLPDANYLGEACQQPGAAARVVQPGVGNLKVNCTTSLAGAELLLATNMKSAALLSGVTLTGGMPPEVQYAESSAPGFSNAPEKGGYQRGDLVFPVRLVHFFIGPHPTTGRPCLMRSMGRVLANGTLPYSDSLDPPQVVQEFVEDLQVTYGFDTTGSDDPATYTFQHGLAPAYVENLRSVRVSVVATGRRPRRDSQSTAVLAGDLPLSVENHAAPATPVADGFYRSLFTRRAELPNLASAKL